MLSGYEFEKVANVADQNKEEIIITFVKSTLEEVTRRSFLETSQGWDMGCLEEVELFQEWHGPFFLPSAPHAPRTKDSASQNSTQIQFEITFWICSKHWIVPWLRFLLDNMCSGDLAQLRNLSRFSVPSTRIMMAPSVRKSSRSSCTLSVEVIVLEVCIFRAFCTFSSSEVPKAWNLMIFKIEYTSQRGIQRFW